MAWTLHQGDCLDVLPTLADASVDAVITDPPYHRVKGEAWDRQWRTDADYLAWLGRVADQWRRVLRPNGSLYCFASPRMAARVEVMLAERFAVLNRIRWVKDAGWHQKAEKDALRSYLSPWEEIVFAEQQGADSTALGASGYAAKCDEVRGFVYEPLRAYLDGERQAAGLSNDDVRRVVGCASGSGLPSHWFTSSQWMLPTEANYAKLAAATGRFQRPYEELRRQYEELRRQYEELRRQYEELRRPFSVSADVPYTDVWTLPTVQAYPGKHPCEKPLAMLRHMVRASTRPGAVVLDCFAGSGSLALACEAEGRDCVLIEREPAYCDIIRKRMADAGNQTPLFS